MRYWSSTARGTKAWAVNFSHGQLHITVYKTDDYHVRCVRGGNESVIWEFDYLDNGDTVTHQSTSLMWQKEDDNTTRSWDSAISYCEGLSLGGYSDWRLPNPKELQTIVNYEVNNPSIDQTYFPNTKSSYYWSSTTRTNYTNLAWFVRFDRGYVSYDYKANGSYVRCVRGGE